MSARAIEDRRDARIRRLLRARGWRPGWAELKSDVLVRDLPDGSLLALGGADDPLETDYAFATVLVDDDGEFVESDEFAGRLIDVLAWCERKESA